MADTQSYLPAQHLYIRQILQEAQHRWLRPAEICEILRNYQNFNLTPEPPTKPPAGSVFLFDRKALRYFRKDGHRWRKKKDGKTVKEAHEKLKAGSVDALHCYYAHGEDNESFQRIDGHLEHIVLVHYREVKEGHKATISRLLEDERLHTISHHKNSLANSSASTIQTSYAPTANRHNWSGQANSPELEDVKSLGSLGEFNQPKSVCHQTSHDASFLVNHRAEPSSHQFSWLIGGSNEVNDGAPLLAEVQTTNTDSKHEQKLFCRKSNITGVIDTSQSQHLTEVRLESDGEVLDMNTGNRLVPSSELQAVATASEPTGEGNSTTPRSPIITSSTTQTESKCNRLNNEGNGELKKLDSFGRWMVKEIGRDCDDSLMASDSGNCWNNLSAENDDREVSSFSRHMHFDIDSPGPSLSQQQLFSINDFSPEWAYSKIETKVLIIGKFLQTKNITKWSCMFGEIEVSAEILTDTSIRCVAPPHAPGRVPFYVTCSNRLACSEVREFEYREMPLTLSSDPQYELHLQVQLAKLLHLGVAEQSLDCSNQKCDKCELKRIMYSTRVVPESEEVRTDKEASILEHMCSTNSVLQSLFKDKLYRWLVYKIHEKEGKGPQVLDEKGQGVLHLVASLGYEWAVGPIIAAGVNPNFRDVCGRTALHWASYFGREETVITLVRFGADTSLVDDPKPEFPGGQTAADLASRRGHKGIAAYLAEVDLTSRLSSLTVDQNLVDSADEVASGTCSKDEEDLSMKRSLAAIRKSARAAALIQFAFRARSFRQRQWTSSGNGGSEASSTDLVALGSLTRVKKVSWYDDYLHSAAIRIQQKYRGWKGRKEFLKIRNRIVKVQACVRGHQVRRQYKKFVWSVSIMEKVILRWRRKRVGLRGFRVENNTNLEDSEFDGVERGDEYDFLGIGRKQKVDGVERALARVKSLVGDPKARDQYMRLVGYRVRQL